MKKDWGVNKEQRRVSLVIDLVTDWISQMHWTNEKIYGMKNF